MTQFYFYLRCINFLKIDCPDFWIKNKYRKMGYFCVGIFWRFSVKMWMFNFGVFNFWCFPKDDCFILVLFKWLEKINARDQCFVYRRSKTFKSDTCCLIFSLLCSFSVDHCLSFFFLFRLAIALPVLRLVTFDNPFSIYKLFLSIDQYTHHYTLPSIKFISL